MKVYYDLHLHSCLSPCGHEDMTPNNIVNMSIIKGLNVIALTDHNTMKNCPAAMKVGKEAGLLLIPGMEIQTKEDVHVVALFPSLALAEAMEKKLDAHRLLLPHCPEKFGDQLVLDEKDRVVDTYPYTLLASIDLGIDEIVRYVNDMGGVVFPAHINKQSNSVLANLGFMSPDWDIGAIEIFRASENQDLVEKYQETYHILCNSDAHYLQDISEPVHYLELQEGTIEEVIQYLREF